MIFRRRQIAVFNIAIICFVGSLPILANETGLASFSEDEFLGEIPVVLTATRLAQPLLEAPAAITIIDREMIKASGARQIAELFQLVPGFLVNHDDGHTPIVMYHGLSDEYVKRLQVLIDGRSVYSPVFGGASWTNIPLSIDDIERIEVTRGPNSASYGSNSFLSIINIITKHPSETTGISAHANRGTNGIADTFFRYGASLDRFDYRLSFERSSDNGFEDRGDSYYMNKILFRGDYLFDASNSIQTLFGGSYGTRIIDSNILQSNDDRNINDHFEQIRWNHQMNFSEEISLQFFHNVEQQEQYLDKSIPGIGGVVRNFSFQAERFDLELQHTKQINSSARIVWGIGARQDSAKGDQIFGTSPDTGYTGNREYFFNQIVRLFANLEWRQTNRLTFNFGTTIEKSDIAEVESSPRLGINFLLSSYQSVRFIASRATRSPSLNETYANFRIPISGIPTQPIPFVTTLWVGNEDLEVENITSFELGYHIENTQRNHEFDLKIYSEKLYNLITLDENHIPDPTDFLDGNYSYYDNLIDATVRGVEVSLVYKPRIDTRVILSHSYTTIHSDNPNQVSIALSDSAPNHMTSLLLFKQLASGVNAGIHYIHATEYDGLGSGQPLPGHTSVNVRLGTPLNIFGSEGEMAVIFKNIGNEYSDWRSDNIVKESMFVSISGRWN